MWRFLVASRCIFILVLTLLDHRNTATTKKTQLWKFTFDLRRSCLVNYIHNTSLSRAQHAHGGGFAGSDVWVALQRLGGTRVEFLHGPDTDPFSAQCQNREEHPPLAIHTAAFVHVLVLLAAGLALCYGESINLTWLDIQIDSNWSLQIILVQYHDNLNRC